MEGGQITLTELINEIPNAVAEAGSLRHGSGATGSTDALIKSLEERLTDL